eukprot:scaffold8374_cov175-Amphora_coffeaeformis.AAC.64
MPEAIVGSFLRKRRRKGRSFGSAENNKKRHSTSSLRSLPLAVDWLPSESMTTPDMNHKKERHVSPKDSIIDPDIPRTVDIQIQTKRSGFSFEDEADDDDLLAPNLKTEKDTVSDSSSDKAPSKENNENHSDKKQYANSKTSVEEIGISNNTTSTKKQESVEQQMDHRQKIEHSTKGKKSTSEKDRSETTKKARKQTTVQSSSKKDADKQSDTMTDRKSKKPAKDTDKGDSSPCTKSNSLQKETPKSPQETRLQNEKVTKVTKTTEQRSAKKMDGSGEATGANDGVSAPNKPSSNSKSRIIEGETSSRGVSEKQKRKPPEGTENVPAGTEHAQSEKRRETWNNSENDEETVEQGGWTCPTCTLHNSEKARRCGACTSRKPVTINTENGNVLSPRSCNTAGSSLRSSGRTSGQDSKSKDSSVLLSTSPDSSEKSSNRKRRQRSPSARRKPSQSPSKKKPKPTPVQDELPKSFVSQSTEKHTVLDNQMESDAPHKELSSEHDQKEQENSEVASSEKTAQVLTGDSSGVKPIETKPQNPMVSSRHSSIETSSCPVIMENTAGSNSKTEEIATISSLRAENESLRQQIEKLEKDLVHLREDRIRVHVGSTQVSRLLAERLLAEFTAQTIASLGRMKEGFLKSHFEDGLNLDEVDKTTLGMVTGTKTSEIVSTGDSGRRNIPPTCLQRNREPTLPIKPQDNPGIRGQVLLIGDTENGASPTITVGMTDQLLHMMSCTKSTEFQRLSSQETVDPSSPVPNAHSSPDCEDGYMPNRNDAPSQSQNTVETSSCGPLSPANSTQTMDPVVYKKSVSKLTSEKSSTTSVGRDNRGTFSRQSPSVGDAPPKNKINGLGLQFGSFGPPSPATSTQTMDPMAFDRNRTRPRSVDIEPRRNKLGPQLPQDSTQTVDLSSLVTRREGSYSKRTTPAEDSSSKPDRDNTLQISRSGQPTPISRSILLTGAFEKNQAAESQATISPSTSSSKAMAPPLRKDPPLENSTNKKSSATWTSNVARKSFLDHLNQSSGTTATLKGNGAASIADESRWATSNRSTKPAKRPQVESSTIWDDSQDLNPNYKYQEVVRCKSKRHGLPCHDCADCQEFYECMRRNGHEFSQDVGLMEHSRHRARFAPSETPADFWELDFLDEKRNANKRVGTGVTSQGA